jgi:hypothetical protein
LISVAGHEIGHAVVADQLGLRVESVELSAEPAGRCFYRSGPAEDLIAAALAGQQAELELGVRDPDRVADCADPDRFLALDHARRLEPADPDLALRRGAAAAREILQRYWSPVERLGEILLREHFLSGARLRALLDAAVRGAPDIEVAAAAAIDKERQAREDLEIMVTRRLMFQRMIREEPGLDRRFQWIAADAEARRDFAHRDLVISEQAVEPGARLRQLVATMRGPG